MFVFFCELCDNPTTHSANAEGEFLCDICTSAYPEEWISAVKMPIPF